MSQRAKAISEQLEHRFHKEIDYQGKRAVIKVAETTVILARKAKPRATDSKGKRLKAIKGKPLNLRFIRARLEDSKGDLISS